METKALQPAYVAAKQLVQAKPTRDTLPVEGQKLFDSIQTRFDSALQAALDDGKSSVDLSTPEKWTLVPVGPDRDIVRPDPSERVWAQSPRVNILTKEALTARYESLGYEVTQPRLSHGHPNDPPVISMTVSVPKSLLDAARAEIRREAYESNLMRYPEGDEE